MSLKLGTTDIAGISTNTVTNAHHLLDFKWTDCIMNDVSWLRADTFSWQSGDVYTSAYNHLVADLQGISAETETIGSYTVTFYRATDGHKICLADQEQTVLNIYNESGIAWYYILDTTNTQFKLPRTKFGFEGLRTNVGDNIEESLPNIKGSLGSGMVTKRGNTSTYNASEAAVTGAFTGTNASNNASSASTTSSWFMNGGWSMDASRSSSTYQDNAPVQERATQMYLYFYVGDYTQSAIEQTAGLNAELFNGKVDINGTNATFPHVVESYINGNSGYIIYSPDENGNKRCIQWGVSSSSSSYSIVTISLLKSMQLPYVVVANIDWAENPGWYTGTFTATGNAVTDVAAQPTLKTNTTFAIQSFSRHSWRVDGYLYEV